MKRFIEEAGAPPGLLYPYPAAQFMICLFSDITEGHFKHGRQREQEAEREREREINGGSREREREREREGNREREIERGERER